MVHNLWSRRRRVCRLVESKRARNYNKLESTYESLDLSSE